MATKKRMTMADVRLANYRYHRSQKHPTDQDYFSRANTKFFGPERFYGPYSGAGGTFFVQTNKAGRRIKELAPNGEIHSARVDTDGMSIEAVRDLAKRLAKGG